LVVNVPIPIAPVTGRQASVNWLTVYFRPDGLASLNARPIQQLSRWKKASDPADAYAGRVAQTPGLWHPGHDLAVGPDGKIYGSDFVPEDH
jgi:hypothetical protein